MTVIGAFGCDDKKGYLWVGADIAAYNLELLRENNIQAVFSMLGTKDQDATKLVSVGESGIITHNPFHMAPFCGRHWRQSNNSWKRAPKKKDWQSLKQTLDDIESAVSSEQNTLVHCHSGCSRSMLCVGIYLMCKTGCTAEKIYSYLRRLRPITDPGLKHDLLDFENLGISEEFIPRESRQALPYVCSSRDLQDLLQGIPWGICTKSIIER
jgi:hypothetical protein